MINIVALLISGALHGRDTRELLERCHPLGTFEIIPVLWVATSVEELYNSVLVETPSEPYFKTSYPVQIQRSSTSRLSAIPHFWGISGMTLRVRGGEHPACSRSM